MVRVVFGWVLISCRSSSRHQPRGELDHEATLAATRLGKPFEKPGPNIREGLDYIDFRGDGVLHVRIADWYRARAA